MRVFRTFQIMKSIELFPGCYWVSIPDVDLRMLCGAPPDVMKLLAANQLIEAYEIDDFYTEEGPNVILLYEDDCIKGMAANLSEFPILQMFYMQGLGVEQHPNFKKERPLLIGTHDILKKQLDYIEAGNNGLNYVEMSKTGSLPDVVDIWFHMKAQFAGTVDMMALVDKQEIADQDKIEIKPEVFLERIEKNLYRISYKNETKEINLGLAEQEVFRPCYKPRKRTLPKARFMVVNTGTGNGWNAKEPCFGSLIVHQEKNYLVDFETFTLQNIKHLNLEAGQLEGIFMTHCHDDHMGGLPNLFYSKQKMKLFCTQLIYNSLMVKVSALTGCSEAEFRANFPHHLLEYDVWNDIDGLEVAPYHSAHPVETSIFVFRVLESPGEYKTYSHLGDIAPFHVVQKFHAQSAKQKNREFYTKMLEKYMEPADLKKIDIGGGMIHGLASDFAGDTSKKIILGHYHRRLTARELKIGVSQTFGDFDILIP